MMHVGYILAGARQLLTMRGLAGPRRGRNLGSLGIIEDGALLVRDGRIVAVGSTSDIMRRYGRHRAVVDAAGKVVAPAFVDSHTHLAFPAPRLLDYEMRIAGRSCEEIARAGGGIYSSVERVRAGCEGELRSNILYFAQQALTYGTATIEVKSGYGLDTESEIGLLEAIRDVGRVVSPELVPTFLGAHLVPRDSPRRTYVRRVIEEMIPRVAAAGLAEFCDVFCDRIAFSAREAEQILTAAARFGMKAKLHGEQLARTGAALLGARLGAVSVDHLERAGPKEIRALARSRTIATLLPGATFHLGRHDYAPARALVDGGAAVALATDFNPGTCPTLSMQMILSLACTEMRLSPAEAMAAATVNAAYALGRGERLGRLDAGMQADIAVFDVEDYREIPYYFGMNHCWMTIKRGRIAWSREGFTTDEHG
jgi:imidazolonepropionase